MKVAKKNSDDFLFVFCGCGHLLLKENDLKHFLHKEKASKGRVNPHTNGLTP